MFWAVNKMKNQKGKKTTTKHRGTEDTEDTEKTKEKQGDADLRRKKGF